MVVVLTYHMLDTISYAIFYGYEAVFLSPGKTWILLWAIHALRQYGAFSGQEDMKKLDEKKE